MSKKMEEVKAANLRVVSEDFLKELQSGKSVQELLTQHGISTWGAEVKTEVEVQPKPKPSTGKSTGKVKEEQGEQDERAVHDVIQCDVLPGAGACTQRHSAFHRS